MTGAGAQPGPPLSVSASQELADAIEGVAARAGEAGLAGRLAGTDATLWGSAAEPEAAVRLGWLDLPRTSRELLPRLAELAGSLRADGLDHVVLAGMGGSSLAPEVITRTAGVELTVLDTTDPGQVRAAIADRLDRTVVVVSSKSGGTVETDSHRRAYTAAFRARGLSPAEIGRRFVVVTDPGSPLERAAAELGARAVLLADPNVGGRYSALSAFGLVPSALAGADVASLLGSAGALAPSLGAAATNPALDLGLALGAAWRVHRDKIVLAEGSPAGDPVGGRLSGFGDWAEQLIAESTGKDGTGLLPVVVEGPNAPGTSGDDVALVTFGGPGADAARSGADRALASVFGPLGAQFLAWEYATAVAGWVLGINPFDQPNVQEAKDLTGRLLAGGLPETKPAFVDGAVEVYGSADLLGDARDVPSVLRRLLAAVPARGYLGVTAFLDRGADASAADLRPLLARATPRAVTFGWGPRYLHSTGQYHKGGPPVGAFLQLTGAVTDDLPIEGKPYTFGTLQAAQAAGDLQALAGRGRPVVRLHLTDRAAGLGQLLEAVP